MPWECAAQRWVEVDWCDWSQLSGAPRKNPLNRIQSTRKLQSNYLDWAHFMMCFAKFMFQKAVRVRFVEFANLQAWKIIDTLSWIQTKMRKRNEDHRFTKIHNPKIAPPKKKIEKNCAMAYMALVPPLPSNGRKWRCLQRSPSNTKIQVVMTTDLDDLAEGIFRGTQTHGSQPCLWLQDQGNKGIDQGLVEIMGQDEWFPGDFFGIRISCVIPKCSAQTTINHIQSSISRCPGEKIWQSCAQTTGFFFVPHGSAAVSTVHASIWPYLPPPVFFHRPSASIHRKLHPRVELLFQALQTGVKHASLPFTTADSLMEPAKYHENKLFEISWEENTDHHGSYATRLPQLYHMTMLNISICFKRKSSFW